jgi:hypothetical protein
MCGLLGGERAAVRPLTAGPTSASFTSDKRLVLADDRVIGAVDLARS